MLRPVVRPAERFEFTDPSQSEPWVLWLRQPDDLELGYASDMAEELTSRYINGGWVDEKGSFQPKPDVLTGSDGNPMIVSRDILTYVTRLEVMQDAPSEDEEYSAVQMMELIPFFPLAWQKIKQTFFGLVQLPKEPTSDTKDS